MTLDQIDRAAFQSWLATEPSYANVGFARQNCWCPLAIYLKKLTGRRHSVAPTSVAPAWIVAFITVVDQQNFYGDPITAKDALNYLANIP